MNVEVNAASGKIVRSGVSAGSPKCTGINMMSERCIVCWRLPQVATPNAAMLDPSRLCSSPDLFAGERLFEAPRRNRPSGHRTVSPRADAKRGPHEPCLCGRGFHAIRAIFGRADRKSASRQSSPSDVSVLNGRFGSISAGQAQIASHRPEVPLWPGAVVQSLQACAAAPCARARCNEQPSGHPAFGLPAASTRAQWPHSASLPNYTRRSRSPSQSVIRSNLDAIPHWTATTSTLSWVLSGDALRDFGD